MFGLTRIGNVDLVFRVETVKIRIMCHFGFRNSFICTAIPVIR